MKLAIVNQHASTGGWRYIYMLVKHILLVRPDYKITLLVNKRAKRKVVEIKRLAELGCEVHRYKAFNKKQKFHNKKLNEIYNAIRYVLIKLKYHPNFDKYDAVFYSWPYFISAPKINKPLFFIPHDFIFSHDFGFNGCGFYTLNNWFDTVLSQLKTFVEKNAIPIVSSDYIKDEYNRVFPNSKNKPNVVYLSKFNTYEKKTKTEIQKVLDKYNIKDDYILFANNHMPHKNLTQVIGAMYYVNQKYPNIKLLVSGYGNHGILGKVNTPYYMDHTINEYDWDVKGIGLIGDDEFSALMQGAKICINASLCEAGAGSGLDAWTIGTPMVMSNIPAFKDQIKFLGVKAELFDPREAHDIARAIEKLLENPQLAKENAEISKQAMDKYSWDIVAQQYIDIFEKYVAKDYMDLFNQIVKK